MQAMFSKSRLKYLQSLRLPKYRALENAFVVEGVKMVGELLDSRFTTQSVFGLKSWYDMHGHKLGKSDIPFTQVTEEELKKASGLVTPNEVLAVASIPSEEMPAGGDMGDLVLLLDRVQDPGNLGTIIRTADWFGISYILCSPGSADVYNPKVVQATMGSVFRVKVLYRDLEEFLLSHAAGREVYAATAAGEDIRKAGLTFPAALVVGNESGGISASLLSKIRNHLAIPGVAGGAESLNASVAAGIFLWEWTRRKTLN